MTVGEMEVESVKEMENETNGNEIEKSNDSQVIGIIYPPPEIRNIVDKTASFAAKHGDKFEERIREKEAGNPKFNFLNPLDPYHAYYKFRVKEFAEGKAAPDLKKLEEKSEPTGAIVKTAPKEPAPFEFISEMPVITNQDLEIVKLTAQFVARNGRQFLTGLSQKESRNYQFDFLRPNHSLFSYFTKLVEHYTKVLVPSKTSRETLVQNVNEKNKVLERAASRAEWEEYQETKRKKEEDEAEQERIAFASIDWHDFVVVGTIEFTGGDNETDLPGPISRESLEVRRLAEKRDLVLEIKEPTAATNDTEMEMETEQPEPKIEEKNDLKRDISNTQEIVEKQESIPPLAPIGNFKVKTDHVPKLLGKKKEETVVYKDVEIPVSEIQRHMKIEMLDPLWIKQKEKAVEKNKESNLVFGDASKNLSNIAQVRVDIFGEKDELILKVLEEKKEKEKNKQKASWDGHTPTVPATVTAKTVQHPTIEAQIAAIHRSKGLTGDEVESSVGPQIPQEFKGPNMSINNITGMTIPRPNPTPLPGVIPPNLQQVLMQSGAGGVAPPGMNQGSNEPAAKKMKMDETTGLFPEEVFLAQNKGPVSLRVQIPDSGKQGEWKLNGQILNISLEITDTIQKLKEKIQTDIIMQPTRMNLKLITAKDPNAIGFLRDHLTLAYYNLNNASIIQLSIKERGRK